LQISFRRGAPEHLSCDDPSCRCSGSCSRREWSMRRKRWPRRSQAAKSGQDIVSVLFQMQVIPPADAHRLLGEHGVFLLDSRARHLAGQFHVQEGCAGSARRVPARSRWALLVDSVRRLDAALLRARLGKKLLRPVVRSGGLALGKVEELGAETRKEARIYAGIDGTRTGEELLRRTRPRRQCGSFICSPSWPPGVRRRGGIDCCPGAAGEGRSSTTAAGAPRCAASRAAQDQPGAPACRIRPAPAGSPGR